MSPEDIQQAKQKAAREIQLQIQALRTQLDATLDGTNIELDKSKKKKTVQISEKSRTFHFSEPSGDEDSNTEDEDDPEADKKHQKDEARRKEKERKKKKQEKERKKRKERSPIDLGDTSEQATSATDADSEPDPVPTKRKGKGAGPSAVGTLAYLRGQSAGGSDVFAPLLKTHFLLALCKEGWWPSVFHRTSLGEKAYAEAVEVWKETMRTTPGKSSASFPSLCC
jgi:hypothetical protein